MKTGACQAVLLVSLWVLGAAQSGAQSPQLQKLTASPPKRGEYFGARVSFSDGIALAGAPSANFNLAAVTSGEVHVFRYNGTTWPEEQILHPSDQSTAVSFGMSVAVNGAVAVVAGYENNACTDKALCIRGAAWVFRYNYVTRSWVEEQKLVPADATTVSLYDWQNLLAPYVSVSGNVVILGIHFDATRGPNTGSAYIYRFDGHMWVQEQKLMAQNVSAGAWFGVEVAVQGDVAVVGAFLDTADLFVRPAVNHAGTAHVFRYDGRQWNPEQVLSAFFDGGENDLFGASVSISGDVILVGAVDADDKGQDSGAAYVFRYNKDLGLWFQEQKLTASDGSALAEFGRSVSVSGGTALVGAFRDNTLGVRSGAVYVFRYVGRHWIQQEKLNASDELPGDRFGRSVSVSGDIAVICAYRKDDACPGETDPDACNSGAAYIFAIGGRLP